MSNEPIKTFISYSWSSTEHQQWVIELATKLRSNGIDIVLDVWDLKEGQDKHSFMEQMVTNKEVKKVIIICDGSYAQKANDRHGGVGTESQIISSELYGKIDQTKFIPVVVEFNEEGACLPVFLKSRIYINLSDEANTDEYEKLLRAIYDQPLHKKPMLGKAPSFLLSQSTLTAATTGTFELLKHSIKSNKANTKALYIDFLEIATNELKSNQIKNIQDGDEEIFQSIENLKPLSEQFKTITSELIKQDLFFLDETVVFFEKCLELYDAPEGVNSYQKYQFDNIKFITRELFLILLTELKVKGKIIQFNELIDHHYYVNTRFKSENKRCYEICDHLASLDEIRNTRLSLQRASLTADLLKTRYLGYSGNFSLMIETDYLLWFRAMKDGSWWFPVTMVYVESYSPQLELFKRAESIKYFEKIKDLLKVKNKAELVQYIEDLKKREQLSRWRVGRSMHSLPLVSVLNLEKLATL